MEVKDFVAIDFEIFTAEYTSACAIGMVRVINGCIIQKFYSLIKPIPDGRKHNNTFIHGITADMLVNAPSFEQIFSSLCDFIGDLPIVCHNKSVDINVFERCMDYYDLQGVNTQDNYCTYALTGLSLKDCCEKYNIVIGCHHDALDDAVACAKVFLALQGVEMTKVFTGGYKAIYENIENRKYERATLDMLPDVDIDNKGTLFYHAKVVITGVFKEFPNRNELGKLIQSLGADVNTAISKKTNIVIMGQDAGPSKIKKIEDLQADGCSIRVIYEKELIELLK